MATDADRLVGTELSRIFKHVMVIRLVAAPAVMFAGVLFLFYGHVWQGVACLAVAVPIFGIAAWEARKLRDRHLSQTRIFITLSAVMCVHLTLVVVTGGITSPILIILPVTVAFLAIVTNRLRLIIGALSIVICLMWVLAGVALTRPGFEPPIFARSDPPPPLVLFVAFVVTAAPVAAVISGVLVRRALEGAVRTAAESRGELVVAMRERNEELLALSGALAHELKNPLSAIRGLAALQAKRLEPGTKQAEQMSVLVDEVARMSTILDEFLNFSRPATGLAIARVDAARLVRDVVHVHEPLAAERGVVLDVEEGERAELRCDPRKVKQILVNLMQNAIDASPEGEAVTARVSVRGGEHVFLIEDRGPGLANAVRGRLFTAGVTTKVAGSGLGLTIARAIAEQHGGSLTLADRDGGGCVAELRLPSAPSIDEEAP